MLKKDSLALRYGTPLSELCPLKASFAMNLAELCFTLQNYVSHLKNYLL